MLERNLLVDNCAIRKLPDTKIRRSDHWSTIFFINEEEFFLKQKLVLSRVRAKLTLIRCIIISESRKEKFETQSLENLRSRKCKNSKTSRNSSSHIHYHLHPHPQDQ